MSDAAARLAGFEASLDPARPAATPGVEVIGYGEVSTVLALEALPGAVCKRMAGFRDAAAAARYVALVERYLALLASAGVRSAETALVPIERPGRGPVVYLVQPRVDPSRLGNHILREADDAALVACLERVLACVGPLLLGNRARPDGRTVTVDAQLSNWHFAEDGAAVLLDVGTPFLRRDGADEIDIELFLAPVPPVVRGWYRRQRAVERYIDAFFDPRRLFVDAIANFHKEGRPDRIPLAIARVNRWLAQEMAPLGARAIRVEDVERYYRRDASTLTLYLRARRLDRFLRTRLLRQRYDYVLPGAIRR